MPYKPKYCCQCGETIDGVERKFWKSGRFCDFCATEYGIHDKAQWAIFGIALVFGLYGIGSYFQKPEKQLNISSPPLAVSEMKTATAQTKTSAQVPVVTSVPTQKKANDYKAPINLQSVTADVNLKSEKADAEPLEKTYFCGATTKKGTMCSRRVKNGGRCWQHEGQTAMLPQEKLLAAR